MKQEPEKTPEQIEIENAALGFCRCGKAKDESHKHCVVCLQELIGVWDAN